MEIIAVDDDPLLLHTVRMVLEDSFGKIDTYQHPTAVLSALNESRVKVIILDLNFAIGDDDGAEGLAWIKKIKDMQPSVSIVVLTAHGLLDVAVKCLKQGATDFLEKPFSNEKLVATVQAALNLANSQMQLADATSRENLLFDQAKQFGSLIVGPSKTMRQVMDTVAKVAHTDAAIFISGEHGTGKELLARFIHHQSARASQPFVLADLGAISEGLFQSTMFGHARGAFTDAKKDKAGLMETANLGTLFLDDIAELPLNLQAKLLVALENQEVSRVGEHRARALDIRLISASNKPWLEINDPARFRQDLLFRINTVHIELPPLRARKDDIKPLSDYFLKHFNKKYKKQFELARHQLDELVDYPWPGNVRELRNSIERMVILDNVIAFRGNEIPNLEEDNLYQLEKSKIAQILKTHAGNITHAAAALGIGRNTLYRKMKKYDL